jgi:RadC-like JAB domain
MLDRKNRLIGIHTVSIGSLTASVVHPREVYKAAILANASAIVFGHNHPSGDPQPSPEGRALTLPPPKASTRVKWCRVSCLQADSLQHCFTLPFLTVFRLAITTHYSQCPAAKVAVGAGALLAYNGNQPVYRYKNQKGIAPAHQNTLLF